MKKYEIIKRLTRLGRKIMDYIVFNSIARNMFSSSFFRFLFKRIEEIRVKKSINDIRKRHLPQHVAIIMDGNRRFAKEMKMDILEGYRRGRDKLEEILDLCRKTGIKILTVYAFSTENFQRDEKEVNEIMELFFETFNRMLNDERIHKHKIKVNVIGNLYLLPENVRKMAGKVMDATKNYDNRILNIAVAYGGRGEIVEATRKIMKKVQIGEIKPEEIGYETISSHLYTADLPDPDIVIRTSGEERISNFLLWQVADSMIFFYDVFWPSFRKIDFLKIIKMYQVKQNGIL